MGTDWKEQTSPYTEASLQPWGTFSCHGERNTETIETGTLWDTLICRAKSTSKCHVKLRQNMVTHFYSVLSCRQTSSGCFYPFICQDLCRIVAVCLVFPLPYILLYYFQGTSCIQDKNSHETFYNLLYGKGKRHIAGLPWICKKHL